MVALRPEKIAFGHDVPQDAMARRRMAQSGVVTDIGLSRQLSIYKVRLTTGWCSRPRDDQNREAARTVTERRVWLSWTARGGRAVAA